MGKYKVIKMICRYATKSINIIKLFNVTKFFVAPSGNRKVGSFVANDSELS